MGSKYSRRQFLKVMGTAAAGLAAAACAPLTGLVLDKPIAGSGRMPMRPLGGTGAAVSLFGLGGQAAVDSTNTQLALDIINTAIDLGVNYIDTAFIYGSGRSEQHIGTVMLTRRHEIFLATKSNKRTYTGVMGDFNTSLSRLNTDYVDLYQVHNIGVASDVSALYQPDGNGRTAIDAFVRLRDEGRARFIGITGHHDPAQLLAVLDHPDAPNFDAILLALNPADWHTKPFQQQLLPTVFARNMGVIAMKVTGMNRLLPEIPSMIDCLSYVYSFPISCAIVGISNLAQLEENITITQNFTNALSPAEMAALENQTTGTVSMSSPKGDWFKIDRY